MDWRSGLERSGQSDTKGRRRGESRGISDISGRWEQIWYVQRQSAEHKAKLTVEGFANAVSIASVAGTTQSMATVPKLGASVIQAASLKAHEWKEMLKRRKGGFGSYHKPGQYLKNSQSLSTSVLTA